MTNLLGSFAMETIKLILLHLLTLQASLGRHFLISTHDEKIKAAGDEAGDDYYDPGPKDYRDYGDCSGWNPANNLVGNCPGSSGIIVKFFQVLIDLISIQEVFLTILSDLPTTNMSEKLQLFWHNNGWLTFESKQNYT